MKKKTIILSILLYFCHINVNAQTPCIKDIYTQGIFERTQLEHGLLKSYYRIDTLDESGFGIIFISEQFEKPYYEAEFLFSADSFKNNEDGFYYPFRFKCDSPSSLFIFSDIAFYTDGNKNTEEYRKKYLLYKNQFPETPHADDWNIQFVCFELNISRNNYHLQKIFTKYNHSDDSTTNYTYNLNYILYSDINPGVHTDTGSADVPNNISYKYLQKISKEYNGKYDKILNIKSETDSSADSGWIYVGTINKDSSDWDIKYIKKGSLSDIIKNIYTKKTVEISMQSACYLRETQPSKKQTICAAI